MTRPATRRKSRLPALLVVLVIVLVALVVADRAGVAIAQYVAGNTIKDSQHLRSRPRVDISGFPFLTQLATGDFDRVTVTAQHVAVDQHHDVLELTEVVVVCNGVRVARDFSSVRARSATATARVDYAEVSKRLGIDVTYAGNGRIKASKKITVFGQPFQPTISARPQLVNGALAFGVVKVDGLGSIGRQVIPQLAQTFQVTLPLQGIPFQVSVRSIIADSHGVTIALTGSNLSYRKP